MTATGIACKTHGGRPRALLAKCTSGYRRALLAKYESADVYIQRICLLFCVSHYPQRHSMNGYWRHRRLDYTSAQAEGRVRAAKRGEAGALMRFSACATRPARV